MKKLLSLLLLLILIGAGLIFAGEQSFLIIQGKTPLQWAQEYLPLEQLQQYLPQTQEADNSTSEETGEEEKQQTTSNEETVQIFLNQDANSDVELVMIAPNGEGATAFRKAEGEGFDRLAVITADGKPGLITLGDNKLPVSFSFQGTTLRYSKYTDSSVEVMIEYADGRTEGPQTQALEVAASVSPWMELMIPSAHANWITELACTGEDCFYNSMPELGTSLNVVFCGLALGNTLFTAGTTAPLAYLSCASLATRVATLNTEIGPCKGDMLICAKDLVLDFAPDYDIKSLRSEGMTLMGQIKNDVTGGLLSGGVISATHQRTGKNFRGEITADGNYSIDIREAGVSVLEINLLGFENEQYVLAVTNARIIVKNVRTGEVENLSLPYEGYADLNYDFTMQPAGFIAGEVIESENAESVSQAQVQLFDGSQLMDEITTDADGTFSLQPKLYNDTHSFRLQVDHADYTPFSQELEVSYSIPKHSDLYDIPGWNSIVKLKKTAAENSSEEVPADTLHIPISFNFTHTGISHSGSGSLEITSASNTCTLKMTGKASGVPQIPAEYASQIPAGTPLPALDGSYNAISQSCTGEIFSTGELFMSGQLSGTVNFSFGGQSFEESDSLPFELKGSFNDGKATGTITIDDISEIPF